jgi:hypothetical protein
MGSPRYFERFDEEPADTTLLSTMREHLCAGHTSSGRPELAPEGFEGITTTLAGVHIDRLASNPGVPQAGNTAKAKTAAEPRLIPGSQYISPIFRQSSGPTVIASSPAQASQYSDPVR